MKQYGRRREHEEKKMISAIEQRKMREKKVYNKQSLKMYIVYCV